MSYITSQIERLRAEIGADIEEIRGKYAHERSKRIRADGEAQYLETAGAYAHYADDDPYTNEVEPRDPLTDEVDVVIVGGGFSGLLVSARLQEVGVEGIRIIEAAADFGGTWYWNRYPGAQCDIESYIYFPLLEEIGYMPKEKYSHAPEIFEHAQRIGKHYDLYSRACFQTRVTSAVWDEKSMRWIVRTDRGDKMKASFVISALGPGTSRSKLPNVPGLNEFEGHTFHTSRWDYEYTGGDHRGNLHKLADRRVAIIGTGATAIQCVPHLGAHSNQLYVFQRTPSSVDVRGNKPTDPKWVKSLQPGWQRERRENFSDILLGRAVEVDLVHDAWTDMFRVAPIPLAGQEKQPGDPAELGLLNELCDFKKMSQIRGRVDEVVKDEATAEVLKPWYRQFCKRPCFSDEYLPTFNRPNVTLVDVSDAKGIERITKRGIVANGVEYEVDCIIFSTGFEIGTAPHRRADYDIIGHNRASLWNYWSQGLRTLHGHSTRGFPNWFYIGIGQNAMSANQTAVYDDQAIHVAYIISQVRARAARAVQPTAEGEQSWVDEIRRHSRDNLDYLKACTPGHYNNEGKPDQPASMASELYAAGLNAFNALLAKWREQGTLDGLELLK